MSKASTQLSSGQVDLKRKPKYNLLTFAFQSKAYKWVLICFDWSLYNLSPLYNRRSSLWRNKAKILSRTKQLVLRGVITMTTASMATGYIFLKRHGPASLKMKTKCVHELLTIHVMTKSVHPCWPLSLFTSLFPLHSATPNSSKR